MSTIPGRPTAIRYDERRRSLMRSPQRAVATTAATRDRTGCPAAAPVTATTASTIRLTADERGKLATLPGNAVLLVVHNTLTGQELGHTTPRDHRGHMLVYVAAARHLTHISASNRCPNFTAAIR